MTWIGESVTFMMVVSPSRRTASSLASDWQSEAVGLIVIINRTGRKYLMRLKRFDEANASVG